jgi:hypothetical protein
MHGKPRRRQALANVAEPEYFTIPECLAPILDFKEVFANQNIQPPLVASCEPGYTGESGNHVIE